MTSKFGYVSTLLKLLKAGANPSAIDEVCYTTVYTLHVCILNLYSYIYTKLFSIQEVQCHRCSCLDKISGITNVIFIKKSLKSSLMMHAFLVSKFY